MNEGLAMIGRRRRKKNGSLHCASTTNYFLKLSIITVTCLEALCPKIRPLKPALDILTTVNSYQSITMTTKAAQTTLQGWPSQVLQSNIIQGRWL
jgi:hypothetical protein